jgi:hypothetical protein
VTERWGKHIREKYGELFGGLEHDFNDFPYIGNVIPTDELIFSRGVGIPPTREHMAPVDQKRTKKYTKKYKNNHISVKLCALAQSPYQTKKYKIPSGYLT